jgi:hypothetical protein
MGTFGLPNSIPNKYAGPPVNLVPIRSITHRPTTTDKKFPVGQFVILSENPSTGVAGELWYLANFSAGVPQWKQIAIGAGSPGIDAILTDDGAPAIVPDGSGNVSLLGGTGINIIGQGPGSTATVAVDTSVITTSYAANVGTATPTLGILQIVGSSPVSTSAAGNAVTISVSQASTSAVGVVELATSAETIAGSDTARAVVPSGLTAKLGTQTSGGVAYGTGTSTAIGWTAAGTANAVLIGGATPTFSTTATIYVTGISFDTGSNVLGRYINTTAFTPVVYGSTGAGTATYQEQSGRYSVVGNNVFVNINLRWTGHTGTGDMMISGLPFIFAAAQSFYPMVCMTQNITVPAGTMWVVGDGINATTTMEITSSIDAASFSNVQMSAAGSLHINGWYPTDP